MSLLLKYFRLGIRAFADQHSCSELLSISSTYTAQHFEEVSQSEEYLLLPIEQLVNILSSGMVQIKGTIVSSFSASDLWFLGQTDMPMICMN